MPPYPKPKADPAAAEPRRRVTIRDIARQVGVSHVTVSYALRGMPRVSEDLRKKILHEAERMGYCPDPMLQALCAYRRGGQPTEIKSSLAWLTCWDPPEEMHAFKEFHAYWLGARQAAEKQGYRLEEFAPGRQLSLARILNILRSRGIRGVLIPPPHGASKVNLAEIDWSGFSLVKFGHTFGDLKANLVTSAHVYNAMLAFARISERGYRRIGFVTNDRLLQRTHFVSGYLRAQYNLDVSARVDILAIADTESEAGRLRALGAWVRRERPDAILTTTRELPAMLGALGLRIPEDLAVAVTSVLDGNGDAGIHQNSFEIGRAGCEMVISQIIHGAFGVQECPRELLIQGYWQDGSMLPDRGALAARV